MLGAAQVAQLAVLPLRRSGLLQKPAPHEVRCGEGIEERIGPVVMRRIRSQLVTTHLSGRPFLQRVPRFAIVRIRGVNGGLTIPPPAYNHVQQRPWV